MTDHTAPMSDAPQATEPEQLELLAAPEPTDAVAEKASAGSEPDVQEQDGEQVAASLVDPAPAPPEVAPDLPEPPPEPAPDLPEVEPAPELPPSTPDLPVPPPEPAPDLPAVEPAPELPPATPEPAPQLPTSEVVPEPEAAEPEPEAAEPEPEAAEPEPEAAEPEPEAAEPEPVTTPAEVPAPAAPTPAVPSPAMFARKRSGPDLTAFGRVGPGGEVFVSTPEGGERSVGSYPGASPGGALAYFARKYDELHAAAELLHQRVTQTDMSAKDAEESYAKLVEQTTEPNAVGDLAALTARVEQIGDALKAKKALEAQHRAAAREEGRVVREAIVAEAEKIAGQSPERVQWKTSGTRMRELLERWKEQQRSGPRLDRTAEAAMWSRFSAARNSFDRARRVHFAELDSQQGDAKKTKTRLVADAEKLATSKDWAATAGAFKHLMDDWRKAGRAGRADDDALWERFKAAQDTFFTAKDAVVAAEEEGFRANLAVKEQLIREVEQILPVTDLEKAKASLRSVQDRWDKAGKVPRADLERTEKALRRVEQAVRETEDTKWASSNPEAAARAQSLVDQLESAVAGLRADLAKAEASGNARKVEQAQSALDARESWLAQARAGLKEFGG